MAAPLQYEVHERDNALYLCLEGDLDEHSFLPITRALLDRPLSQPVKVDLQRVRYADSAGLRALVLLQRQARDAGVDFILLEPSRAIRNVFHATGLADLFHIHTDDPEDPCS